ncbi:MAG: ATP-grasp domain-containing protein [Fimbriiglobus sp.]
MLAVVTAQAAQTLDQDLIPFMAALGRANVPAEIVLWDDPAIDWSRYSLVLIRSTWDYVSRYAEFLAWCDRVEAITWLANPADLVRWNTDKRYLRSLELKGIPVVPTVFVAPGESCSSWPVGECVVKPTISAGAVNTERFAPEAGDAAKAFLAKLLQQGMTVMVQPYLSSVDARGETSLVYFHGQYSHSFRKGPILKGAKEMQGGLFAAEQLTPTSPTSAERDLAEAVMHQIPGGRNRVLYARVDLIQDDLGQPCLLELELTEPSVNFDLAPGSADRFAQSLRMS